jgi:hypothetical protein
MNEPEKNPIEKPEAQKAAANSDDTPGKGLNDQAMKTILRMKSPISPQMAEAKKPGIIETLESCISGIMDFFKKPGG